MTTCAASGAVRPDRKSTRLNSSHMSISYAVFCLKKRTPDGLLPGEVPGRRARPGQIQPACKSGHAGGLAPAGPGRPGYFLFFNDTATPEIYPLSLHDALPISYKVVERAGFVWTYMGTREQAPAAPA